MNEVRKLAKPEYTNARSLITAAMHVLRATSYDEDLYNVFDGIDDSINLAKSGIYGEVQDCYKDLDQMLDQFRDDFSSEYNVQFDADAARRST